MICTINDYELRELHESIVFFELWGLNFELYDLNYKLRELHESIVFFELWGLNFELYDLNYKLRELRESLQTSMFKGKRYIS